MISFNDFKAAARRYKYETAFDADGGRVSYSGFYDSVTALFNSLHLAGAAGGRVTLFTRDRLTAATVALGCIRAGCALTSADPRLCLRDVRELASRGADLVFLPAEETDRIGPLFADSGCKSAVISGRRDTDVFPAAFEYSEIMKRNAFPSEKQSETDGTVSFCGGGNISPPALEIPLRTPVYAAFPAYSPEFFTVLSELLSNGRRCIAANAPPSACAVICAESERDAFGNKSEVFTAGGTPAVYAGGGLFDAELLSSRVSEAAGEPAKADFDGARVRVVIETEGEHVLSPGLKNALFDLLRPYDCKKTLVFRKKTN